MHIFGHPMGITAHVKIGAILEPGPQFPPLLFHSMLDVNFLGLIAGKRQIQAMQNTLLLEAAKVLFIKEVGLAMLLAEEKPVAASISLEGALFQEGAEGGDPCA